MLKRKGARESPCLRPLLGVNSLDGLPLIKMDIVAVFRQPFVHFL